MRILFPDAQFPGEPEIEREVAGPEAHLDVWREHEAAAIADAALARCPRIALHATPARTNRFAPMKWVNIKDRWYNSFSSPHGPVGVAHGITIHAPGRDGGATISRP